MPAPSLVKLCIDLGIANCRHIEDVGELPYHLVRPIITRIENPNQLRRIEKASPQICGADADAWKNLIKRNIPNGGKDLTSIEPKNPRNWWKVYRKLAEEDSIKRQEQEDKLRAALGAHTDEKASNKTKFLNKVVQPASVGERRAPQTPVVARTRFERATTLQTTKRQSTSRKPGNNMNTPTHQLAGRSTPITSVPKTMMNPNAARQMLALRRPQRPIASPAPNLAGRTGTGITLRASPLSTLSSTETRIQGLKTPAATAYSSRPTPPAPSPIQLTRSRESQRTASQTRQPAAPTSSSSVRAQPLAPPPSQKRSQVSVLMPRKRARV